MKYRISLCISALCFLTAFLIALSARQQGSEALASRIAPEILRFHILANSDSDEDQQLKMEVKGLVIDYVNENLGENATKETTAAWLTDHSEAIEDMAHRYLLSRGKDYPVSLMLTRDYFPTKATWCSPAAPTTRPGSPSGAGTATTGGACSIHPCATRTP